MSLKKVAALLLHHQLIIWSSWSSLHIKQIIILEIARKDLSTNPNLSNSTLCWQKSTEKPLRFGNLVRKRDPVNIVNKCKLWCSIHGLQVSRPKWLKYSILYYWVEDISTLQCLERYINMLIIFRYFKVLILWIFLAYENPNNMVTVHYFKLIPISTKSIPSI